MLLIVTFSSEREREIFIYMFNMFEKPCDGLQEKTS